MIFLIHSLQILKLMHLEIDVMHKYSIRIEYYKNINKWQRGKNENDL